MRHVAALLLLLLTPGLLLPAGLWLHVCRCAPLAAQRSCCHAEAPATPTCCHRGDAPVDGDPSVRSDDCGCSWLPLPDRGHDETQPDLALPQPPAALPALTLAMVPPPALATGPLPRPFVPLRGPPPPGTDRNLPLRL